jgi:methylmalonyl-CoA mutase
MRGAGDVFVICWRRDPPEGCAFRKKAGVSAIYGPGTNIPKPPPKSSA